MEIEDEKDILSVVILYLICYDIIFYRYYILSVVILF